MAGRNGGILNALLKIDVRQFIDDKHRKLVATVNIDLILRLFIVIVVTVCFRMKM